MAKLRAPKSSSATPTANIGFEATLRLAADKLRSNMDASEFRHVVLGSVVASVTGPFGRAPSFVNFESQL